MESGDVDTEQSVEETAAPAPEQSDTPNVDAPADGADGAETAGSLTAPNTEAHKTQSPAAQQTGNPASSTAANQRTQQPDNWQKRYSDLQSTTQRRLNEMQRAHQERERELNELREFRQKQTQQAQQAQLKPWTRQHPEHSKFLGTLERSKLIGQQLRNIPSNLPPEQQEAMKQSILSGLSGEDQQLLSEYQAERENFFRDFQSDPRGTFQPIAQEAAREVFREEMSRMKAEQDVEQELNSPELRELVREHAPELQKALKDGVPYDYGVHLLKLHGDRERMRLEIEELRKQAGAGREQIRLAQGKASITRDPAPSAAVDVYALAKKEAQQRGITTDDPRFLNILARLEKSAG